MSLNRHEKHLIDILEKHPNINTREFIKLADLGKTTFYKYTDSLQKQGYISYEEFKNQKEWYLMKKRKTDDWGMTSFAENKKTMEKNFDELESKILKSVVKAKTGKVNDKVVGYGDSTLLLLSHLGLMRLIYYYRKKHMPNSYIQFENKIEKLLEKITDAGFNAEHGYGRLAIDHIIRTSEERLDEFLGIKKPEITFV
jgi:hypothetical protein